MLRSKKIFKTINQKELKNLEGYFFWNNINIEKKKFWFLKKKSKELEDGLVKTGLQQEFNFSINFLPKKKL
jgi:hypothetical protein